MSALRRTLLTTASLRPATKASSRLYQSFSTAAARMADHKVTDIHNKAEWDAAMAQKGVAIVDFSAEWCGPCKAISPKFREHSTKYDTARFYKIDVDEVPEVAQEMAVRAMPTFLFFKDGEKVESVVGANPPALEKAIAAAVA